MNNLCMKLKHFIVAFSLSGLLFGLNSTASAEILVDQPYLAGEVSYLSNVEGGYENADSFSVSDTVNITSVMWWGTDAGVGDFLIRLGSSLGSWSSLTGTVNKTATTDFDSEDRSIYQFEQFLASSLTLTAGDYFLSISHETEDWYWTIGTQDGASGYPGSFWIDEDNRAEDDFNDFSFQLTGERQVQQSVPEPNVFVLMLIGMVMGSMVLRRRKTE